MSGERISGAVDDGPEGRTARKRAERVARIIQTAARQFAVRGYESTNFNDIAAELDLRGPSLYYYFPSKEHLFSACLNSASEQVFARLLAIAELDDDPLEILRRLICEQIVIELRDFPEFVPLFYGKHIAVPALREEALRLRRLHAEIFEGAVARLAAQTDLDKNWSRVWLGVTFGAFAYVPEWFKPDGRLDDVELAEMMSETLISSLQGIAATPR